MKGVKKWRKNLQTIEFPNYDKYSDNQVLKIIFEDVPERSLLLKWIALKISDSDPVQFTMTLDDLERFFSERGLLSPNVVKDFIQARCSRNVQEESWKILFSFTRMHKFLKPPNSDRVGIHKKFTELLKSSYGGGLGLLEREPSVTIEEMDSDMEINVEREVEEIKNAIEERSNKSLVESEELKIKKEMEQKKLREEIEHILQQRGVSAEEEHLKKIWEIAKGENKRTFSLSRWDKNIEKGALATPRSERMPEDKHYKKKMAPLFNSNYSVEEIKQFVEQYDLSEDNLALNELATIKERKKDHGKEWFRESEVIPRIYIMPGSPPLGQLDPAKLKIVAEDSAPPINLDGLPSLNHSQWQYRIYEVNKPSHSNLSFEEYKAADRLIHVGDPGETRNELTNTNSRQRINSRDSNGISR